MGNEKRYYNRNSIIENYSNIAAYQIDLLPFEVQMAVAERIYATRLNRAREQGSIVITGKIHPIFEQYFKLNGCVVDVSNEYVQVSKVTSVSDDTYIVSEESKNLLDYYLNLVISARLDAFESYFKRLGVENLETAPLTREQYLALMSIRNEFVDSISIELTQEELEGIIAAELYFILETIKTNKKGTVPDYLADTYKDYLLKCDAMRDIHKVMVDISEGKDAEIFPVSFLSLCEKRRNKDKN
ncbi:MAG: hypothetical protein J1F35_02080 [Erysipelotrichales bacterium]|nr:hypothetical protein [Erysipelotrichales bacterium]